MEKLGSKFSTSFQNKVISSILSDRSFTRQIYDIIKPEYFDAESAEWLVKNILKYMHEFEKMPTLDVLKVKINTIERDVLKTLNGDCETPIGAFAFIKNNELNLETELFSLNGKDRFYESLSTELKNFKKIGLKVGTILKKKSKNSYKR